MKAASQNQLTLFTPFTPREGGRVEEIDWPATRSTRGPTMGKRYELVITDLGRAGDPPADARLGRLVRALARAWGFRCTALRRLMSARAVARARRAELERAAQTHDNASRENTKAASAPKEQA